MEKEKDIAFLKYNLQELETNFHGKQEEVDSLKADNVNIENEVKKMHDQYNELKKQFEIKMENIALKNELLEKKIASYEKQTLLSKKSLEDKISSFDENIDEINKLSARVTTTEKTTNKLNTLNDEAKRLSEHINLMKDNQEDINNAMAKVDNLKGHVTNIENILFCDSTNGCTDILIQWKLQNYQYHFDIGKLVYSPIFLTQIKGYCFKLWIGWSGEEKENLGLYLQVCGSNYDKPLEPFKMPYSLELVDNKGNILSKKISVSIIEANRERNFTLPPESNECIGGVYSKFLSMPGLNNYILNDMLSIQCRLTPL